MKIKEKLQAGQPVTLAFFGDSVTHGYFESFNGMHGTTDYGAVYHTVLRRRLTALYPDAAVTIINAGVGGDNVQKGLVRLAADVLDKTPDFVVVCFGLNDINGELDDYTAVLGEIFDRLIQANIEVIFMTPNMLNTYVDDSLTGGLREYAHKTAQYQISSRMDTFMAAGIQTAREHGAAVCDCYGEWKRRYEAGEDTTALLANKINHPVREMHGLFADKLLDMITKGE